MALGRDDVTISVGLQTNNYEKGLQYVKYASLAAFAAVGASAVYAVRKFQEFEQGLAGVQKVADFSAQELKKFEAEIDKLSRTIPVSKTALYETAEAAAVLGIRGGKNLTKFAETMGRMAVATDLSGEDAAKAIARVIQLSGEAPDTIDRFGSALVSLGNNFKASESEILANATRIRQSTAAYEIASTEILAIATATKEAGIQSELAGTAIGRTIRAMDNALAEGGKKLKAMEEIMGQTGDQIERVFRDSPAKAFQIFVNGLKTTNRPTAESGFLLKDMGLQGERLMAVLPSLAKTSDRMAEAFRVSNKAYQENNSLVKESNAFFKTSISQQALFKNKLDSLAAAIGKELAPLWNELLMVTGEWIDEINNPETLATIRDMVTTMLELAKVAGMVASNMKDWLGAITSELGLDPILGGYTEAEKALKEKNRKILKEQQEQAEKEKEIEEQKKRDIQNIQTAPKTTADGVPAPDTGPPKEDQEKGMTWEEELEEFRLRNESLTDIEEKRNEKTIARLRALALEKQKLSESEKKQLEKDLELAEKYEQKRFIMAVDADAKTVGSFAKSLDTMSKLSSKHGKEYFYLAQAMAVTQTIMNTATGVMKAFADPTMGYLGSKVAAAAVVAEGLVQLAVIDSQQPPGMRRGGIVPRRAGTPATGDHQMAYLEPGELVTPKDDAQETVDMQARRQIARQQDFDEGIDAEGNTQRVIIGFDDDISDFVFVKRRMNQSLNIGVT